MGKSTINPAVVGQHSTDIAALKNDLGIVEDGETATHTIAQGQYVIWQGALYTADAAIASGTTLAASGGNKNLTAVENGGLNALSGNIAPSVDTLTNASAVSSVAKDVWAKRVCKSGGIKAVAIAITTKNGLGLQANAWTDLFNIPSGYESAYPNIAFEFPLICTRKSASNPICQLRVQGSKVQIVMREDSGTDTLAYCQIVYV